MSYIKDLKVGQYVFVKKVNEVIFAFHDSEFMRNTLMRLTNNEKNEDSQKEIIDILIKENIFKPNQKEFLINLLNDGNILSGHYGVVVENPIYCQIGNYLYQIFSLFFDLGKNNKFLIMVHLNPFPLEDPGLEKLPPGMKESSIVLDVVPNMSAWKQ